MSTIKIFNLGEAWEQPAVAALLKSPGIEHALDPAEADAFACWGMRPPHEDMVHIISSYGLPVIVMDSGYLGRSQYGRSAQEDDYYAISLGGILRPGPTAKVLNFLLHPPKAVSRRSGLMHYLDIAESKENHPMSVVILGQTVGDRSHGLGEIDMVSRYKAMNASFFRPHPQDDVIAHMMAETPGMMVVDKDQPLMEQLSVLGGPHNVVVKTICSNAGLEAKLAGYTVEADTAWYKDMGRCRAFFTACGGQFNCQELKELGYGIVSGLINLKS
jgi:capsule polysaccharide export protein KpsC/LpsZ